MAKSYQWYYDGSAIGGATGKTHTLTSGQTNSDLIECRVEADFGADKVAALAEKAASSAVAMSIIDVANLGNFGDTTASGNTVAFGAGDTVFVIIQYIPVSGATFTMDIAGTAASIMTWDPGTGTEDANLTIGSTEYEVWSASISGTPTNDVSITATGELNAVVITVVRASGLTSITDFVAEIASGTSKATSFDITSGGRSFGMHYSTETAQPTSIVGSVDSYTNDAADFVSGAGTGFEVTTDHSSTTTETVTITGPDDTVRTVAVVSLA